MVSIQQKKWKNCESCESCEMLRNVSNVANVAKVANVAEVANGAKVAKVAKVANVAEVANVVKVAKVAKFVKVSKVRKCQEIVTKINVQNETGKTFHDELQQILKLGRDIKVIPWTARASLRSKTRESPALSIFVFPIWQKPGEYKKRTH